MVYPIVNLSITVQGTGILMCRCQARMSECRRAVLRRCVHRALVAEGYRQSEGNPWIPKVGDMVLVALPRMSRLL
jgi:hypothetical protein